MPDLPTTTQTLLPEAITTAEDYEHLLMRAEDLMSDPHPADSPEARELEQIKTLISNYEDTIYGVTPTSNEQST